MPFFENRHMHVISPYQEHGLESRELENATITCRYFESSRGHVGKESNGSSH